MKNGIYFVGILLALMSVSFAATINIDTCQNLDVAGTTYVLSHSISTSGNGCFVINAPSITLDCQGYSITGNNTYQTSGIYSAQFNTTIQNCNINNFMHGIRFYGATNGMINNVHVKTTRGSGYGIFFFSSSGNTITDSITNSSSAPGIFLYASSRNAIAHSTVGEMQLSASPRNTISNNNLAYLRFDIGVSDNTGNVIYWNNFTQNTGLIVNDASGGNHYSAIINDNLEGNIWFDVISGKLGINGTTPSQGFQGLYAGNTAYSDTNSLGRTRGVYDQTPLTTNANYPDYINIADVGVPTTLDYAGKNYIMTSELTNSAGVKIIAANVTLNCNGYSITGTNASGTYGVYSDQFNTTVQNCNIGNFETGIYFNGATNGIIANTTASTTSGYGIYLKGASRNSISNSTGAANTNPGIYIASGSDNILSNVTGTSISSVGIRVEPGASNNIITNSVGSPSYVNTIVSDSAAETLTYTAPGNNIFQWNNVTTTSSFTGTGSTLQGQQGGNSDFWSIIVNSISEFINQIIWHLPI